jgi:hypothetical protein
MGAVADLVRAIEIVVPHEVVLFVLLVVGVLAAPSWLHAVRARQIRSAVRRVAIAPSETRAATEDAALAIAAGIPRRLEVVAEEAARLALPALHGRALAELARLGAAAAVDRQQKRLVERPPPRSAHPIEDAAAIRRLLSQGLDDRARERLADARRRFPDDPDLRALAEDLGER